MLVSTIVLLPKSVIFSKFYINPQFPPSDVVVSPPFVYLDQVVFNIKKRIEVAGQNVWVGKGGAFTGEVRCRKSLIFCPF